MPCPWTPPADSYDALLLTSAQAPRLAGAGLATLAHLPAYAVGARTAEAARAAGLSDVRTPAEAGVAEVLRAIATDGPRRLLHLAGRDHKPVAIPPVLSIERRIVYEARLAPRLSEEARAALRVARIDWVLVFSARTAAHFAALCDAEGIARDHISVTAISRAAADAAGPGWARVRHAEKPGEAGILAAAGLLCDKH